MAERYTNTTNFQRDIMPAGTDEVLPRIIDRAAAMAYDVINAKLGSKYTVPFSPVPDIIVTCSDWLTKCFAVALQQKRAPLLPKGGKAKPLVTDCDMGYQILDALADGTMAIPGVSQSSSSAGLHTNNGYSPVFGLDDSMNHEPSSALIDATESERD